MGHRKISVAFSSSSSNSSRPSSVDPELLQARQESLTRMRDKVRFIRKKRESNKIVEEGNEDDDNKANKKPEEGRQESNGRDSEEQKTGEGRGEIQNNTLEPTTMQKPFARPKKSNKNDPNESLRRRNTQQSIKNAAKNLGRSLRQVVSVRKLQRKKTNKE